MKHKGDKQMKSNGGSVMISLVAILALAGLEGLALYRDIDGAFFMPVVTAIALIAGVKLNDIIGTLRGGNDKDSR